VTETRTAVVLMGYGTPRDPAGILPYYTDIRRGHPPTDEQLAALTARYEAIGGVSPLTQRTEAQRDAVQTALDQVADGQYHVVLGMKHAAPFIETAVDAIAAQGFRRAVGLVLAPHYSAFSVGQYLDRLTAAATAHDISVKGIESWATDPAFVDFISAPVSPRCPPRRGFCSQPTRCRSESSRPAIRIHRSFRQPPNVWPQPSASTIGDSPGRAPDAHPNPGWGPTSCR
jgi:protoheme ferro-lyase